MRVLKHREDAEDVVQDAFLRALEHIDRYDPSRPFWPWLARIVVNRGLDVSSSRAARGAAELDEEIADVSATPADAAERGDAIERLRGAVQALPPRRRLVVQLFELDGLSTAEIAELIGGTTATVRWHLHVARRQLRTALASFREGAA